jgi:osmotically-inducible protein OsmY
MRLVGNVRSKHSREAVRRAASAALGTAVNADALTDDIQLETDIGLALERAGLTRTAEVFVRCTLGDVILFGYAPSQSIADEVVRATEGQPGVRAVHNRIEIGPGSRDSTPAGAAR